MKTVEVIGFKRANLGKRESVRLREEANVPCVLYGGKEQVHFYTPMYLFKDLIYTPDTNLIELTVDGKKYKAIVQDKQFDPVNEMLMHVDLLELQEDKEVKIEIPVKFVGTAPGVVKGGKLVPKIQKLKIKALPKNLPQYIEVDISSMELGKSVRVGDIKTQGYTLLQDKSLPIASVAIPRALKGQGEAA